jgi:hypothetical protein
VSRLRVAAIQHDIIWHDREANFERLAPTHRRRTFRPRSTSGS